MRTYYTWDARNRLIAAEPASGVVTYAYDGLGRRVSKLSGGETVHYVYDFEKVLQEADGSGTTEQQYLSTEQQYGDLVSAYGDGASRYYDFDALGSTEALLDDTGSVTSRYAYRAYGLASETVPGLPGLALPAALPSPLGTSGSGSGEVYTWVGKQGYRLEQEVDLYLLGSGSDGRYYDPTTARFLSKDPLGFGGGDANLYRYVGNDPINEVDPNGRGCNGALSWILRQFSIDCGQVSKAINNCSSINLLAYFDTVPYPWRINSVVNNIIDGILKAFWDITNNIEDFAKQGLADWLHLDPWMFGLKSDASGLDKLLTFALEISGYTWDNILNKIKDKFAIGDPAALIDIFYGLSSSNLLDYPINDAISYIYKNWISQFASIKEQIKNNLTSMLVEFIRKLIERLITKALKSLITKAILAVSTGGIGAAIKWVSDMISVAADKGDQICSLIRTVLEGARIVLHEGGSDEIRDIIKRGARAALPLLFDVAAAQAGIPKASMVVAEAKASIEKTAQKPVDTVLNGLKKLYDLFIADWIRKAGIVGDSRPLAIPAQKNDANGHSVRLWVSAKDKSPKMKMSPEVDVCQFLDDRKGNACLAKVRSVEKQTLKNATKKLTAGTLEKTKVSEKDVKEVPANRMAVETAEGSLLDAILKCGPTCAVSAGGKCFAAGTMVWKASGERGTIESKDLLGHRVLTWLHGEAGFVERACRTDEVIGPETHWIVWLVQETEDGNQVVAGLLRTTSWLAYQGIERIGDWTELSLKEMGVTGAFQVMGVDPWPVIESGSGRIVTGWFSHRRGGVSDLWIEGEPRAIGTTARHPFWSADRSNWIPASELLLGERVLIKGGFAAVLRYQERGEEPVFNLEVDADHCYRVGEQGVLVHNQSGPKDPCSMQMLKPGEARLVHTDLMTFVDRRDYVNTTSTTCITPCATNPRTDTSQLVKEAFALVDAKNKTIGTGSGTGVPERRWARCLVGKDSDDAGHVIGNKSLGGSGMLVDMNLFPQEVKSNQAQQRTRENRLKALLNPPHNSCRVCAHITLHYDPPGPTNMYPGRPTYIVYDVWVNGVQNPSMPLDFTTYGPRINNP